jgi:hypothetical protein
MDRRWTEDGQKMDRRWTEDGQKMDRRWPEDGQKMGKKMDKKMSKMHRPGIEPGASRDSAFFNAWQRLILPLNHRCGFSLDD